MNDLRETLAERDATHGGFPAKSSFIQQAKSDMRGCLGWQSLAADQQEALDAIQVKIGRILFGNADHRDNWHDIAGYATLVDDRLGAKRTDEEVEKAVASWIKRHGADKTPTHFWLGDAA